VASSTPQLRRAIWHRSYSKTTELPNRQAQVEPLKHLHGKKHITGTSSTSPTWTIPKSATPQRSAKRLFCRRSLLALMGYTDKWILHMHGILLPGLGRQRTMPLQVAVRHGNTLSIPATGRDLDPLILADPSHCWTTGGPDMPCRRAGGLFVRLADCHVSFTVWCRCRTIQHPATPQHRARRQGSGLRDNVQHRRREHDRSR
jgi:hypothetical protein